PPVLLSFIPQRPPAATLFPYTTLFRSQIILSTRVLELIRTERQPILIDDVSADERFSGSESLKISGLRSAMCAPLMGKDQLFGRSEEHTSELQSRSDLVCRLLLEKKNL